MSIDSIGEFAYRTGQGRPAAHPAPTVAPAPPSPPPAPLAGTARLLGLSAVQLAIALRTGTTLSELAGHRGISTAAVHASVETDLGLDAPDDGAALSDQQLEQIATGMETVAHPGARANARFDAYA